MKSLRLRSSTAFRTVGILLCLACSAFAQEPRLANISTRAQTGPGAAVLTAGFVIGPGANKQVLIRAIGPTLGASPFNVAGSLADPVLTVFNSAGTAIATNDDWGTPVGTGAASAATLSSTFGSVGAFALGATSRDSAVVVTLAPGNYTAQVAGKGTGTGASGNALLEVYEIGGANAGARLVNTSTRLQVSAASAPIIGFVVAPGTGTRKLLVRTAGPALTAFGLTGTLPDPSIRILNSSTGQLVATNDNWNTPSDTRAADTAGLTAAFSIAGAFAFPGGSNDAAVLVDLAPGNYGIQVGAGDGSSGLAIIEVYDLTPANVPTVSIAATKATADETGNNPGEFTVTRSGDTSLPLLVNYGISGSAVNGYNYPPLLGTVAIPVGAASVKIPLSPNPVIQNQGSDTVVLSVATGSGYLVGAQASATVTITHSPATLYVASVRPTTAALTGTAASGTATLLLSATGRIASINVTFSNLSSTQVTAHLVIGSAEDYVVNLPPGQVTGAQWVFAPTGPYSIDALLEALRTGNIAVRIDTAKYPSGELKGAFIQGSGSRTFTPPAAPPPVSLANVTANDAARFLTQATFGPTKTEIDTLTGSSIDAWITAQLALPFTSHRTATVADRTAFGGSNSFTNWNAIHMPNRQSAWFKIALTAPDQLRQRVAYALSQILVVSDISLGDDNRTEPLANYYDILGNGAFGNYRTLLENVTLSPMMGEYLSSLRNSKADPVTGQTPDENYAREIMQLFTIGLSQLNPDGTLALGADGLPVATYDQATITEMAKVFTGWAYPSTNLNAFRTAGANYFTPMQLFPAFHDDTAKNIVPVTSAPIPAAQGGARDLQLALDALANHPNTAPFISRLLIQRLVTSNPSPGYVYRVAQVWTQQKSSTTQLGQVVRAILTDYEARSPAVIDTLSYGKLKEPLLRLTALLRGFGASSTSGRFLGLRHTVNGTPIDSTTPRPATAGEIATINSTTLPYSAIGSLAQAALRSPTVFNFYHPDYVLPGPLAAAGLVAPEFEITDDNFAISVPNYLRTFVNAVTPVTNGVPTAAAPYVLLLNTTYEQTLLATPSALLDHLARVLAGGNLPAATRTRITSALAALPTATTAEDRAKTAILLVLTSPTAAIQK